MAVVEVVIVVPLFMVIILIAVQMCLWAYAANVAQSAAAQGAQAAQQEGATLATGAAQARAFLQVNGSSLVEHPVITGAVLPSDLVRITVTGGRAVDRARPPSLRVREPSRRAPRIPADRMRRWRVKDGSERGSVVVEAECDLVWRCSSWRRWGSAESSCEPAGGRCGPGRRRSGCGSGQAAAAQQASIAAVAPVLAGAGRSCQGLRVDTDASQFKPGGQVRVTVTCIVNWRMCSCPAFPAP